MKEAKEHIKKILESAEEFMRYVPDCQKISMTVTPEFFDSLREAYKALEDREWTPVTEGLPKEGKYVLFCDIDDDIMLGYHLDRAPATHFTERGAWEDIKNVRAWMELPEPYKGGDS